MLGKRERRFPLKLPFTNLSEQVYSTGLCMVCRCYGPPWSSSPCCKHALGKFLPTAPPRFAFILSFPLQQPSTHTDNLIEARDEELKSLSDQPRHSTMPTMPPGKAKHARELPLNY
ncbi:hypothetical protein SRHO_G00222430 [Serrasalmus rhombeus]